MRAMEDELFTLMLTIIFAAVMVVAGEAFIDQRNRAEASAFLNSLALSPARAASLPQRRNDLRP